MVPDSGPVGGAGRSRQHHLAVVQGSGVGADVGKRREVFGLQTGLEKMEHYLTKQFLKKDRQTAV